MRPINQNRKLIEHEGHRHTVKRGRRKIFHFENFPFLEAVFKFLIKAILLLPRGQGNALDIRVEHTEIVLSNLPQSFDGIKLLLITDLHIDCIEALDCKIIDAVSTLDYDYCLLGGDYSFGHGYEDGRAYQQMKHLANVLLKRTEVFAILGNHDCYSIAEMLNEQGVKMLLNDFVCLQRNGDKIYLVGIDDSHYFNASDIPQAQPPESDNFLKIMLTHSPEPFRQIESAGYSVCLCGHTHGGQVCLPNGRAIVTSATVPHKMIKGNWEYNKMKGYTSAGAGTSGVAVRYFCPPEIALIKLSTPKT